MLEKANILLNPRNMLLSENKNNFPSKIMEYLATGRVIVSTKFPSYRKFCDNIIFSEVSINDLSEAIEKALNKKPEEIESIYEENRKKAQEFRWEIQVKKMLDGIEKY